MLCALDEGETVRTALVKSIEADLTIDWAGQEATEAAIRAKIKRLLRRHGYKAPNGGARSSEQVADLILDQARVLYRMWPDVWQGELIV